MKPREGLPCGADRTALQPANPPMQAPGERTDSPSAPGNRAAAGPRWLRCLVAIVAAGQIALVLLIAVARLDYPYELEWMEGGVLEHVARLRAGEPIYVEPGFRFVPFIYPPLYYYVCVLLSPVMPPGFFGPRLVSLAASVGCMALVFLFVRRETGGRLAGLCAAALYAATFEITGGWFDLARVDSLFPLFVLGGALLIRFGRRGRSAALAGVLFAGAFFVKQSAIVFVAPLLLFCLIYQPRRLPAVLATGVVPCLLLCAYFHWASDGWFSYYVFALPRQHALEPSAWLGFWLEDLLRHVPLALGMIVLLAAARLRGWRQRPAAAFYAALALGGLGLSWLSRLHTGGEVNVLMPAFAAIAILFGLALAELPKVVEDMKETSRVAKARLRAMLPLAVVCQLLLLAFNPFAWLPGGENRETNDKLVAWIRGFRGDVIVPTAPYLAARAGKPTTAHLMALMDVLRATGSPEIKAALTADIRRRLRDPRYEAILLCSPQGWFHDIPIPEDFVYIGEVVRSPAASQGTSGIRAYVPNHAFVRRRPLGPLPAAGS